ncbi:MAG: hypothetical protein CL609_24000 [Anaerolineaceae bacterium]|nr:hypothetical protein [Anaerolineaceae bacterium]
MIWLLLFIIVGIVEWAAAGKKWRKLRVVTKPLSLILLFIWFGMMGGWQVGWWFGLGLVFSLAGDVFLLLRSRYFIAGLGAFLTAHICYIIGYNQSPLVFSWWMLVHLAIVGAVVTIAYPKIIGGLRRRLEYKKLTIPVSLYILTIVFMLISALFCWFRPDWGIAPAVVTATGALLFTISDSLLAAGRFLRPIPYGNFMVMFTYHLGQLGIISGVLMANGLIF